MKTAYRRGGLWPKQEERIGFLVNKTVVTFIFFVIVNGIGFILSTKYRNCGKEYGGLRIRGFADKGLKSHIQACHKKVEALGNGSAQGE